MELELLFMKPTLLIISAGMGSRYGSLKQIDPVGPNGEIIIDYSIYDAIEAGFEKIVFQQQDRVGGYTCLYRIAGTK